LTTIEHKDLVDAVLATRDLLDPDLETEVLEAVVDAEAAAAGDGEAAMRAIDAAVTAAIERGVGYVQDPEPADVDAAESGDEEDET
jgi:hypothetical protein